VVEEESEEEVMMMRGTAVVGMHIDIYFHITT
jgi:hypothetical protein